MIPDQKRLQTIDRATAPIIMMPAQLPKGCQGQPHTHRRGQLIYPYKGRYCVHLTHRLLTGSAHQAIWIPAKQRHCVEAIDALWVHNVYIDTQLVVGLPSECKIFSVSVLLAALLEQGTMLAEKADYAIEFHNITLVVADQIRMAKPLDSLALPLSQHPKIQRVTAKLLREPGCQCRLEECATWVHTSERTLSRLFIQETGLTFRQWRQRLYVKEAINRLADGQSVMQVAIDLGYSNQSAFTQMFRRMTGNLPSSFIS